MTDKPDNNANPDPYAWGSEPIRGLNYDYLNIDKPPEVTPTPVMPDTKSLEFSSERTQDFYQRTRTKIVAWAENAGAGQEATNYILLVPDIIALMTRIMQDPRVSSTIKAEIAAASAYIVIPVDLMPEAFMGPAGLIDDAIVGMFALNRLVKAMGTLGEDMLRQYWDGEEDVVLVMNRLLENADSFVNGKVWNGIKTFMGNIAQSATTAARNATSSSSTGPIIEGSARPILPKGSGVQTNTNWQTSQSGSSSSSSGQSGNTSGAPPKGTGPQYDR